MPLSIEGKPIRTVLRWQLLATVVSMLIAGLWVGFHGAASALLGGLINFVAGVAFGLLATRGRQRTAGEALVGVIRAEGAKVALIVAQLWLVLSNYEALVPGPFFGTFVLTVIFFSLGFFVRDR